jgi:Flp pilus assembly pilin Flp
MGRLSPADFHAVYGFRRPDVALWEGHARFVVWTIPSPSPERSGAADARHLEIVWGLVSVVLLLAYGQGLGGSVLHAFLNMGNDVIVLWPGQASMQAGGQRAGKKVS